MTPQLVEARCIGPFPEDQEWRMGSGAWLHFGRGSYAAPDFKALGWLAEESIHVGRFCSIASGVSIMTGGGHDTRLVSTYPFDVLHRGKTEAESRTYGRSKLTVVGSDVWIATNVMVGPGVQVGHGAVLGMGAVVTKDVPPYAVVLGNPAEVVRFRFDAQRVDALLELAWWDWPYETVLERIDDLCSRDVTALLAKYGGKP